MNGLLQTVLALLVTLSILYFAKKGAEAFIKKQRPYDHSKGRNGITIVSVKQLDHRKSMVLVEENGYEHLLLLGPTHDLLVHTRQAKTLHQINE